MMAIKLGPNNKRLGSFVHIYINHIYCVAFVYLFIVRVHSLLKLVSKTNTMKLGGRERKCMNHERCPRQG